MRRVIQLLSLAALGYAFILVRAAVAHLPPRIPVHFGLSGAADAFGSPRVLWLILAMQALITVLVLAITPASKRLPELVHIGRHDLGDLDPASQAAVLNLLSDMSARLALVTNLLFIYIERETIRIAYHPGARFPAYSVLAFIGVVLLIAIVYTRRMFRYAPGRQKDEDSLHIT